MTDSSVQVGNVTIPGRVFLAPLAGFTDLPFRQICRKLGAWLMPLPKWLPHRNT